MLRKRYHLQISLNSYRYLFFLNRSFGDLIGCIAMLVACIYIMRNEYNFIDYANIPVKCDVILFATYWSAMVTYVSLSLLRLFAVAKPFLYQRMITMRRCVAFISVSWLPAIAVVVAGLVIHALVREEKLQRRFGYCRLESCTRLMYRIRHYAFIVVYVSTLAIYALTLMLLRKAHRFRNSFRPKTGTKSSASSLMPQSKLAMSVGIFALLHSPHLALAIYVLQGQGKCFVMWHRPQVTTAWGIIRTLLIIRIIVDTMLGFVYDNDLRMQLSALIKCYWPIRHKSERRLANVTKQSTVSSVVTLKSASSSDNNRSIETVIN